MPQKQIKVTLKTLTPFWTGNVDGKSNELKLTSIIGSLRWWFEALVRGMMYYACDSTKNSQCEPDIKNSTEVLNIHRKICPVCYLFGTTGWKSRFLVEIEENQLTSLYNGKVVVRLDSDRKKYKGWHYESGSYGSAQIRFAYKEQVIGEADGNIIKLSDVFPSILKILLYLIGEYGMLGAKTSMGYGVVDFKIDEKDINIAENDWEKFETYLSLFDKRFKEEDKKLPNLKEMFFVKFKVSAKVNTKIDYLINKMKKFYHYQDGILEAVVDKWKSNNCCITAPVVRKEIRSNIKSKFPNDSELRHFLMGKVAGNTTRFSSIQVSHVYKNPKNGLELRIYGWLPNIGPINGKVPDIENLLSSLFQGVPWKSYIPSEIQKGICWDGSKLSLVNNNVKYLFIKSREVQNGNKA